MRTYKETKDLIKMYKDLRATTTKVILSGQLSVEYSQALSCINSALSDLYLDLENSLSQVDIDKLDRFEAFLASEAPSVSNGEVNFNVYELKAKVS